MHRIGHDYNVAKKLLDKGYLSTGFSGEGLKLFEAAVARDKEKYYVICDEIYMGQEWWAGKKVKHRQPYRFLTLNVGDIVVTPLWNGKFSILEVLGAPEKIIDFDISVLGAGNGQLYIKDGFLLDGDRQVDLGFVIPVKAVASKSDISRADYADSHLTSRMKFQQTNIYMDDIKDSIDGVIAAKEPLNFYNTAVESMSGEFLKVIRDELNPDKFEKLVKWFMDKQGFKARIAANERGKKDNADADIVADNELLKLVIQIQAKHHKGITDDWAVEQISRYGEQKSLDNDNTYIQWVISTADDYSEEAKNKSIEKNVRLIDGPTFARMLIDAGVDNINDAF